MALNADKLIPELILWNNGVGIDVNVYLSCIGNYEHAIAYADLFWPDFVVHDDCVFRNDLQLEVYNEWLMAVQGNREAVESVMNHIHILDLFPNVEHPPSREQVVHIGRQLQQMWTAKLFADFPNRNFIVRFEDDQSDDLLDYVLTFFQSSK